MRKVKFQDLGKMDYKEAWDYQETLFRSVIAQKTVNRDSEEEVTPDNHLLFVEHPHVYTLGKSGQRENLLIDEKQLDNADAKYYEINRGGDITYHGPGQIVGYPIFDLDQYFTDIHKYLRYLEEAIILTLAEYGVTAARSEGLTGVWLDADNPSKARKIAAMGVKCSRWVTMHGFAFNVNVDLDYFGNIVPCGIADKQVTSLHLELGKPIDQAEVSALLLENLANLFDFDLVD
ncbi:MAG: lipoyl(octanoyl) transferase [Flavobacteriales bacterium]|jgi:lipoyl(octanoyl) transferase